MVGCSCFGFGDFSEDVMVVFQIVCFGFSGFD